jgi:glycosyltransferase involved in cell wall biosynthesis
VLFRSIPHLFGKTIFTQAAWPLAAYVYLQERTIPRLYRGCEFQVLSESTREDLLGRGIPAERLHVIRSGIDHGYYQPPPGGRATPPGPVLLYLGRLKKYKCIEHPILVLPRLRRQVPGAEYWIVGEGDYRAGLEAIAREQGVSEAVRFFGFKDGAEKLALLHQTRVLLYTSPKEGWGLSVIEANATGVPCVASDSPGLKESVQHGQTGFLVPHGDLQALEARLSELLLGNDLWGRMSAAALEWAGRFNWDTMAEETSALITRAVAQGRRR